MSRIISVPYPEASPVDVLLLDNFVDTNGTNLTAHTPDIGGPWTNWGGTIEIQSNTAIVASDGTYAVDTERSDVTINARIKCGAANGNFAPSIVLRGTDSTHYLIVYFSGDGNLQLYWRNGAAFNVLSSTTWSADTSWHDVIVVTDGTDIDVTIDGGGAWSTTALQQAAGTYHGVRGFTSGGNSDAFESIEVDGNPTATFPSPFSSIIDSQDFVQANGTTLASLGWTVGLGTWTCEGNQAEQALTGGPTRGYTVYRNEAGDFAIEGAMETPSSGEMIGGLCFRVQDADHYIELELNTSTAYTPSKGFGCWYTDGGSYVELMTSPFVPSSGTTYTLRITCVGTKITCECVEAGLKMFTYSSQFQTETLCGLFEYRDGTRVNPNHWDTFVVYG